MGMMEMNDGDFSIPNQPRAVTLLAHVPLSHNTLLVTPNPHPHARSHSSRALYALEKWRKCQENGFPVDQLFSFVERRPCVVGMSPGANRRTDCHEVQDNLELLRQNILSGQRARCECGHRKSVLGANKCSFMES